MSITRTPTPDALADKKITKAIKTLRDLAKLTDGLDAHQERQLCEAEADLLKANGLMTLRVYLRLAGAEALAKKIPTIRMNLAFTRPAD